MSRNITLDYETFYHKKDYSVRGLGNWRYCHDPLFDAYLLSVYDGEDYWVGHPKQLNWDALAGATLVAHNAGFDSAVTSRLTELGIAPALNNPWLCTANMTASLFNERSLAGAVYASQGRRLSKGVRDDMGGLNWDGILRKGLSKDVLEYAKHDSIECWNLLARFGHRWSSLERGLSALTIKQCARGVAINTELLGKYISALGIAIQNLEESLPWVERGSKPSSPIAIAEQCQMCGIPCPPIKGDDEEGHKLWESTWGPRFPWVYGAGKWRSMGKLLASLETIKTRLRPDNTIDFSLLYFGGHTGRWSGGGAGLNLQNLRKEPLYVQDGHLVEMPAGLDREATQEWLKMVFILDVRKLFVPRPGKKFIIADLAQIEPRVLNWLAGNQKLLDMIATGFSYYEAYAQLYKGWQGKPGTIKNELGGKGYTLLKNECLGLGYGMGWERFMGYVAANGGSVTEDEARQTVAIFRENNPLITGLWSSMEKAFKQSVNSDFVSELPSGREMVYRDVRREVRTKRDKKTGEPVKAYVHIASVGPRRVEFYGGKLTENLVQAAARDVFGEHLLALEKELGDVVFHVHDEAIVECDQDATPEDALRLMSRTPDWIPGLPLAAEAQEAAHYKK